VWDEGGHFKLAVTVRKWTVAGPKTPEIGITHAKPYCSRHVELLQRNSISCKGYINSRQGLVPCQHGILTDVTSLHCGSERA
jgi:hypothetical protein